MGRGIFNIVLGLVFAIGGFTGKLVLLGTNSGPALGVVGIGLIGLGIWRFAKAREAAPPAGHG